MDSLTVPKAILLKLAVHAANILVYAHGLIHMLLVFGMLPKISGVNGTGAIPQDERLKLLLSTREECARKIAQKPGLISFLFAGIHQSVGSGTQVGTSAMRNSLVQIISHENYQVDAVIRVADAELWQAIKAVIDTGAGPSFIRKREVPKSCKIMPLPVDLPRVVGANGEGISLLGVVEIDKQLGAYKIKELMIVTKNLPVSIILGTNYHDRYISVISPKYRYIKMPDGS